MTAAVQKIFKLRPGLRRPLSAVSLGGILDQDKENKRVKRVKTLTAEQKASIQNLTDPSQLSHAERKRQYGALDRRLKNSDTLPAGVLAKWEAASSQAQKLGAEFSILHTCSFVC